MRSARLILATLSIVVGCSKKSAPPGPDCPATIASILAVSKAEFATGHNNSPEEQAQLNAGQAAQAATALKLCTDDKWSDEVRTCYAGAKARVGLGGCLAKMTVEQQDHAGAPAAFAKLTATLTALRDVACKCADAECAAKIVPQLMSTVANTPMIGIRPSQSLPKIKEEMKACMTKLAAAARDADEVPSAAESADESQ